MAAPHVAGAWAVHKQHSPGASVSQILNTLESTGVPITDSRNGIVKPRIEFHLSPVQTATPTPTPSSTPGSGSCSNIMRDGSFESDPLLDWYGSGSTYQYPDAAYFGNYSILMGYNVDEESLLWQEQAVPSNLTSSSVSFWYYLSTQESGSTPYDHFVVSIRNAAGTVTWATIAQLDNIDVTSAWSHFDYTLTSSQLAAIAGQSGRIEFRLTNDYSLVTQVYVDDVVWNVCSSGPGSIATPTSTRPPSTTPTYTPTPSGTLDPVFLPVIIK